MRTPRRLTILSAGPAAGLLAFLLLSETALAATRTVEIGRNGGDTFTDEESRTSTSTIHAGDTVTWTWDTALHSTTSGSCPGGNCVPDGNWDSGEHTAPFSFSHTFNTPGTFPYYCSYHGAMMQGTIVVQAAGTAPTASFTFSPSGVPVMGTPVNFTDTSTGSPTSWAWNFGDPASGASNTSTAQNPSHVFQAAGSYTVALTASNGSGSNTASRTITVSTGGGVACVTDPETLCLNGARFAVTAEWTKPDGSSGHGTAIRLTSDSGYFWFFDSANIEVVTKVLNGCSLNNGYWVFAAGLTNVQVDLRVLDTQTGIVYTKQNPLNTAFAPIQDTGAFPSSCP